jgi:ABC-type cobalamin/Fe3+-siderophores transport system ATPase subunit
MLTTIGLSYNAQDKFLIKDISLSFNLGSIYGIIGPNGSGKTTLLKVLTGIWKASGGNVFWQDKSLFSMDRQMISRTLSLVPQNAQVHFDFTVAEVVEMGTYPREGLTKLDKLKIVQWALELVDAWHLRDCRATHISHGERQRMYIARSLATQSPVLILDEPTSNLDIRHQLDIWKLLRRLVDEKKIVIVSNHDLEATKRYCDCLMVLNHGLCVAQGAFQDIVTPEILASVFGIEQ